MTMINPNQLFRKQLDGIEFVGTVVANNCPTQQERVTVRIKGLFDEVPDGDLPWFLPMKKPTSNTATAYYWDIPDVGSMVTVTFPTGDIYKGRYYASALDANMGIPNYPNTYGFRDVFGNSVYVDKQTGDMTVMSGSGSVAHLMGNGDADINCTNCAVTASNKVDLTGANVTVHGSSAVTVNSPSITVQGDTTISATNSVSITAAAQVTLQAPSILLG